MRRFDDGTIFYRERGRRDPTALRSNRLQLDVNPEAAAREDATPAARPEFWLRAGFALAVDDDRTPSCAGSCDMTQKCGLPGRRAVARAFAVLAVTALAIAGCASSTASPAPLYTAVPIGPTAWPSGTTGQFGLAIDPSLLAKLPQSVGAVSLVEDAASEAGALDNADLANTFDRYAAAQLGELGDSDWVAISIGHFKTANQYSDLYAAWVDQYDTGACSHAGAVSGTSQPTIGFFLVDAATCNGGVNVYSLQLGDGYVASMFELGPRHLGQMLIEAMY
jgi:hypothetical protein